MPTLASRLPLLAAGLFGVGLVAALGIGAEPPVNATPLGSRSAAELSRQDVYALAAGLSDLGRQMFNDVSLSASGAMSCASCHAAAYGFAAPNVLPVQLGGADMKPPSLTQQNENLAAAAGT